MRTLILCGGKGTRAYPRTVDMPKPLLEVAGTPILRHVMDIFARQGFSDFVLAAGFKAEMIADFAQTLPDDWTVDVHDTGPDTNTGDRVARCADVLGDRYLLTYGDGLGNVDLADLLAFHDSHRGATTVTTVPLPSQYGTIESDAEGRVERFVEKPHLPDHWINAGFFVMDRSARTWFCGDDLERHVLPALSLANQLYAYRHRGFWQSMDTYKDAVELTALASSGTPPWTVPATTPVGART